MFWNDVIRNISGTAICLGLMEYNWCKAICKVEFSTIEGVLSAVGEG